MKLKIIVIVNIITIILCIILSGLYFVSNPGGIYLKPGGFLPTFEYTSEMQNYKNFSSYNEITPVTITTTDRSVDVCVNSYANYNQDLVMGNYENLETIQFSEEELSNMSTITIDDVVYTVDDGNVTADFINGSNRTDTISYAGNSIEELASATFYYSESKPSQLYTSQYIDTLEFMDELSYYIEGFFTVSSDNSLYITMTKDIEGSNLNEHIQISLPYQIEETCTYIEPNSTYVIDSTGGHYE